MSNGKKYVTINSIKDGYVQPTPKPTPPPTPPPCIDDDAEIIIRAAEVNMTVTGCADVVDLCEHEEWGKGVQAICPVTCQECYINEETDD